MGETIDLLIGVVFGWASMIGVLYPELRELRQRRRVPPPAPGPKLAMPHYGRSDLRVYFEGEWEEVPMCKPSGHPLTEGTEYYEIEDLRHPNGGHAVCVEHAVFPEEVRDASEAPAHD